MDREAVGRDEIFSQRKINPKFHYSAVQFPIARINNALSKMGQVIRLRTSYLRQGSAALNQKRTLIKLGVHCGFSSGRYSFR